MTAMSPELLSKVAVWRAKAEAGTLTEEDMAQGIKEMRAGRYGAAVASDASKRKKAQAAIPDSDDLLKELGDL